MNDISTDIHEGTLTVANINLTVSKQHPQLHNPSDNIFTIFIETTLVYIDDNPNVSKQSSPVFTDSAPTVTTESTYVLY